MYVLFQFYFCLRFFRYKTLSNTFKILTASESDFNLAKLSFSLFLKLSMFLVFVLPTTAALVGQQVKRFLCIVFELR